MFYSLFPIDQQVILGLWFLVIFILFIVVFGWRNTKFTASCLVYIQILINDTVTRSSIISRWQVVTHFVNTSRDWAIIVEWNALLWLLFSPPRKNRKIDFEWCINLNVWKLVLGPGNDMQLYLHWICNKIIWDFKMTSKELEYRLVQFREVEVHLYFKWNNTVICLWEESTCIVCKVCVLLVLKVSGNTS